MPKEANSTRSTVSTGWVRTSSTLAGVGLEPDVGGRPDLGGSASRRLLLKPADRARPSTVPSSFIRRPKPSGRPRGTAIVETWQLARGPAPTMAEVLAGGQRRSTFCRAGTARWSRARVRQLACRLLFAAPLANTSEKNGDRAVLSREPNNSEATQPFR